MKQREEIEWTPVSEGLPDGPGPYLYTNARGVVGLCTPGYLAGQSRVGNIIAWAYMPRSYKPEDCKLAYCNGCGYHMTARKEPDDG